MQHGSTIKHIAQPRQTQVHNLDQQKREDAHEKIYEGSAQTRNFGKIKNNDPPRWMKEKKLFCTFIYIKGQLFIILMKLQHNKENSYLDPFA